MHGGFWTDSITNWIAWLAAGLSGVGGKALFDWWMARQKASVEKHKQRLQADVALMQVMDQRIKTILEDDEKTIARLRAEIEDQNRRLDAQQKLFTAVWAYVDSLINALTDAGIPVPQRPKALSSGSTCLPEE